MGIGRLLLDTPTLLWAWIQPELLSEQVRRAIEDPSTIIVVSSVTAWELATKYRLGRLPEAKDAVYGYQRHLARFGAQELRVTAEHALRAGLFRTEHRGPFDCMLAAQGIIEDLPIATKDEAFSAFPVEVFWS